VTLLNL